MNTKHIIIAIVLIATSALFFSCDTIKEGDRKEQGVFISNGRKSLLIDFTGHHCPNCPEGHRKIKELQEAFPNAIVPVAVHATYFANSDPNDEHFYSDYTTNVGNELGGSPDGTTPGHFNIISLPVGAVNSFVSDAVSSPSNWASELAKYVSAYPEVSIEINPEINATDSTINATVKVKNLIQSTRNLKLGVYLIESGILSWQEDSGAASSPVENYEHNHILRAGFTETFGIDINTGNATMNVENIISKDFLLSIDKKWKLENCGIVAFVYDNDSKEVIQAEEKHLSE